ncbi:hybrid sensor histidine kinase/response regulator [Marichromatium bheemlicum]|uniref:histidine kinase n=1 Tax=Marichromatium bheemlicum TaxID=365339 RepID=A0ABX1I6Y4_9GAMM|nr:hybrid sensor histidine kinase/response regulator [Marichromatium bheemlicum]NKN33018.1 response regulator [Marichromatium bheemlicum]
MTESAATARPRTSWTLAIMAAAAFSFGTYWYAQIQSGRTFFTAFVSQQQAQLSLKATVFDQEIGHLKRMTEFLASVPPVSGIGRVLLHGGIDPVNGETFAVWKNRLDQIYLGFLRAEPRVFQARFIGVADNGLELIRVERDAEGEPRIPPSSAFQRKGERPYFIEALAATAGSLVVSAIELNREHGKIERPHRPTVRVSTPVANARGETFAVVVVNYEFAALLDELSRSDSATDYFLTDGQGHYLLHPSAAAFEHEFAQYATTTWQDDFTRLSPANHPAGFEGARLVREHATGDTFIVDSRRLYSLGDGKPLTLHATYPLDQALAEVQGRAWANFLMVNATAYLLIAIIAWLSSRMAALQRETQLQRALNASMEEARDAAEQANAAKSQFLANMSHEIRTPLNAVLGLAHLLGLGSLDTEQRDCVTKIQAAGKALLGIVNDILDLSKIEAGELVLEQIPFSVGNLCRESLRIVSEQAREKGLAVDLNIATEVPDILVGDATRLRQILLNLLTNAVKFTSSGGITLRATATAVEDDTRTLLRLEVEDTGVGIPTATQQRLFAPFVQADDSTTRRFGGTGLGLAIVRQIIEQMGGEVSVESTEGSGSIFRIEVALEQPDDQQLGGLDHGMPRLEIVIAEDDAKQRAALIAMAHSLGWQAEGVADGRALIEQVLERNRSSRPVDCLIVDWRMPGIDGLAALEQLHDQLGAGRLPATILLTAEDIAALDTTALAHRPDSILVKPVDSSTLFNQVNSAVVKHTDQHQRLLEGTELGARHIQWLPDTKLLLIDDSALNLDVARRLLERQGATVETCGNGQEALARLGQPGREFDAVLLDVQMPLMDGIATVQAIRSELGLAQLPVIALTAGALSSERQRALAAGMNDYLTKPFEPDQMVRILRRHIERARGAALPVAETQDQPPPRPQWPAIPGLQMRDAERRLDGDWALFQSSGRNLLQDFADLQEASPPPPNAHAALADRLHRLAGSAGLIGAEAIRQQAKSIEHQLRQPAPPDLTEQLSRLAQALRNLQTDLHPHLRSPSRHTPPDADDDRQHQALDAATLEPLRQDLVAHRLTAVTTFEALAPRLETAFGATDLIALDTAIRGLRFDQALDIITAWRTSLDD